MRKIRRDWRTTARMRAKQAIEAGDKEAALKAVDGIWDEGRPIHDPYGDMAAYLFVFGQFQVCADRACRSSRV